MKRAKWWNLCLFFYLNYILLSRDSYTNLSQNRIYNAVVPRYASNS